jgi:hypothetical protein
MILLRCRPTIRKQTLVKDFPIMFCTNKHMFRKVNWPRRPVIHSFKTTFSLSQKDTITKMRCILVIRTKTSILNTLNNKRAQISNRKHRYSNQPKTKSGARVRSNNRLSHRFKPSHHPSRGWRATDSSRARKRWSLGKTVRHQNLLSRSHRILVGILGRQHLWVEFIKSLKTYKKKLLTSYRRIASAKSLQHLVTTPIAAKLPTQSKRKVYLATLSLRLLGKSRRKKKWIQSCKNSSRMTSARAEWWVP